MPIFMDRHDVSEAVTAEIVADLHQKDLKIQHKFNCKGLTYWFDGKRKTAFCLVEAPDKESIQKMHDQAHGEVPHRIIEVDGALVESFLGRIEDPEKSKKTTLNIINDPAFRIILVAKIKHLSLEKFQDSDLAFLPESPQKFITNTVLEFKGRIVKQKNDYFLLSFISVSKAILCALKLQEGFKENFQSISKPCFKLQIGLCAGIPVSEKEGIFEDTIQMAERLCSIVKADIAITSEVGDLYESENLNQPVNSKYVTKLPKLQEKFLNCLLDFMEKEWNNPALTTNEFSQSLGLSKSQFYRKMISLTGVSPNSFIKLYRLQKAIELMMKNNGNISEIAYETGFATPAYFSKCFQKVYHILPSVYAKSLHPQS